MKRRVHIYMQDCVPCRDGSGSNNRLYSNVRAYLDLGYDVEVVCVQTKSDWQFSVDPSLEGVRWTHLRCEAGQPNISALPAHGSALGGMVNRGAYWLGWPVDRMFDFYF